MADAVVPGVESCSTSGVLTSLGFHFEIAINGIILQGHVSILKHSNVLLGNRRVQADGSARSSVGENLHLRRRLQLFSLVDDRVSMIRLS